jgi:fatty-acyl-CoA synthase
MWTTERLAAAAERSGKRAVFVEGGVHTEVSWRQLHDEALVVGASLQARGVQPGDHVAILAPTSRGLVTAIRGCWLAGAASMVLPLPMRMGSVEEFVDSTRIRILHGDAKLLLIDDMLAAFYAAADGDPPIVPLADVLPREDAPLPSACVVPAPDPERLIILQYTSGSTADPKGVMIPDRVLCANIDALCEAAELNDDDVLVSWLPLYHDMGLVGILGTSFLKGVDLVLASPQEFLSKPLHWMEWISTYRGTATAGPNFAWVLAARALRRGQGLDLSSMRIGLNGAEPVDPDNVETFIEAATPHGFPAGAVFPAFGMAELAIAGSFPPPMRGLVTDPVDREVLENERVAKPADPGAPGTRRFPLLGKPVPGLEMRVCDPSTGDVLDERHVGELEIRGTSVTPGYYKRDDLNAKMFRDGGWMKTGDLAYVLNGELILCGRIKDVIIVGGRNIFPEDIERALNGVDGVRAGNVVAFGVEGYKGKESIVIVAESRADGDEIEEVRKRVHTRALEVAGVPARDVMLVRSGSMPKTSSGKLQRSLARDHYLAETLDLLTP